MNFTRRKRIQTVPNILRKSKSRVVNKMIVNSKDTIDMIKNRSVSQFDCTSCVTTNKIGAMENVGKIEERNIRRRKQNLYCRDLSHEEDYTLNACAFKMSQDAQSDKDDSQASIKSSQSKAKDHQVPMMSNLSSGCSLEFWFSENDKNFDVQSFVEAKSAKVETQEIGEVELQKEIYSKKQKIEEMKMREIEEIKLQEFSEFKMQEIVDIEQQKFVEIESEEFVKIESQEFVKIDSQEFVKIDPLEFVDIDSQEFVGIESQELLEIESQEFVEIEPQEFIEPKPQEIFPDICLLETVDMIPLNINKLNRMEQKNLISYISAQEENQDFRVHDKSVLDVKWHECSICNKIYTHRNSVYRHRKKAHRFNVPTVEKPKILVTSALSLNNHWVVPDPHLPFVGMINNSSNLKNRIKTSVKQQLAPASSSSERENRDPQTKNESVLNLPMYYS